MREDRPAGGVPAAILALLLALGGAPPLAHASEDPLPVKQHRGFPAVAAAELPAALLSDAEEQGGRLRARLAGSSLELWTGSPFFRFGDRVFKLANPPYRRGGKLWIPAELWTRWLPETLPGARPWKVEDGELVPAEPGGAPAAGSEGSGAARRDSAGGRQAGRSAGAAGGDGGSAPFRVVIDPGHGGRDPGTRGPNGTLEKNVTLGVARRLRAKLEERARIEPILTRKRDTLIALRERSRTAVEHDGDLFLSIHANASEARSARGFESYFLSPARTARAREVAMRENSAVKYEQGEEAPDLDDVQFILADLDHNINVQESSRVAGYVQNSLRPVHTGPDRGVKQAKFLVLLGASGGMPSVLVEVGFLSNPNEGRVLRSSRGQERIADALADAVVRYYQQYSRRIAVGGGSTGG